MMRRLRALPFVILLLPFDFIVALCLGVLAPWCSTKSRRHEGTKTQMPERRATIIIVSWDGKHLLAECLPALIEAVKQDGSPHEILVVDNGSTDGSVDFIRRNFPTVRVLELDRNYGFTGGNNRGVDQASTDIVVLLNNDMVVDRAFLKPLLDGFSDPSVFAVTSQIFFADAGRRREETGKTRAIQEGILRSVA